MLRELNELGTHSDLPPSGYSYVIAHWNIDISTGSITQLITEKSNKKLELGKKLLLPDLRRNADDSLLIDDGGEYVFGVGSRGKKRSSLYCQLLDHCIAETNDEGAKLVKNYIQSCNVEYVDETLSEIIPPKKKRDGTLEEREPFWWGRDRFVFTLDGEQITQRSAVKQWWSKYYASKQDVSDGTCLLTGEQTLVVRRKMPMMVKGVPGIQSSGAALTSFDKAAYQSHGWDGTNNAPIGYESSVRLHQSLNMLLRNDQHHYRLGSQVFVFWGNLWDEGLNPELWTDPAAAVAKNIFTTPDKPSQLPGQRALSRRFYLATLKGNKGRIALSSWSERTPEEIKTNVKRFVESQQCAPGIRAKPIWVLRNCAFRDHTKEHTDTITTALIQSALFGVTLTDNYALRVCDRICVEQDVFKSSDRLQALAFYLASQNPLIMEQLSNNPQIASLNSEQVAFILGRIAFLMHKAQVDAQKMEREETNVSRALRTLSTTPALMFPRLYYGCISHHLVDREGKNLKYIRNCLDQEFAKFGANFDPSRDLPQILDAKAQSCFFLGWGIRRAEFFQKQEPKEKTENKS